MANLKFLIKGLAGTNYSAIFKTAKRVAKKTKRPFVSVVKDMVSCVTKHSSGYLDYEAFELYDMSEKERGDFLSIGRNVQMVRTLNNKESRKYFEDKAIFNEHFNKYLKREWMLINGENFDDFEKFCSDKNAIFAKPLDENGGTGVEKIYPDKEESLKACYDRLYAAKAYLIEEEAIQCDEMSKLCSTSVNTVRLITFVNKAGTEARVAAGAIRMGKEGSVVDNFHHDGMAVILDVNEGVSVTDGVDKLTRHFEKTAQGTVLKGFKVPMWEECKKLVEEAALVVPDVRYVGWDVCITEKYGPILIEGNSHPSQDLTQSPKMGLGTYAAYMKILDEIN